MFMPVRLSLNFLSSHVFLFNSPFLLTGFVLPKVLAQGKGEVGIRMVSTLMIKSMVRPYVQLPKWFQWEQCPCAMRKDSMSASPLTGIK